MHAQFSIGQIVQLRADPARIGSVIALLPPVRNRASYRVFHSPTQIVEYVEDQLELSAGHARDRDLAPLLSARDCLTVEEFRARLTAQRLSHPQTDALYALQAARIDFIPFQFKPLLRLLRSETPRLLIADEVGVGKTIEAGLILRELQTRQNLNNILIVCPKSLVEKWRLEMRRFDEDFRPLTSHSLAYCLRETELDGVWPVQYSRAIAHLELLRCERYCWGTQGRRSKPGLMTLETPPAFDLVIVDEAHHLRNPNTRSWEIGRFLCEISEAVLFLSATPMHLGNRNLYTLLNLLYPELFSDEAVFHEIIQPNAHVNQAIRHVRTRTPPDSWPVEAAKALKLAAATPWGQQVMAADPRYREATSRLQSGTLESNAERIACLRDLEELNSLARFMNRTRRRDIGKFTIREPHTISVPFTPAQQAFYDALIEFRQQVLALELAPQVVRLVADTLERQASSCLPALLPSLADFIRTGRFSPASVSDTSDDAEDGSDDDGILALPPLLLERAQQLQQQAAQLPPDDPKLDSLIQIVEESRRVSGSHKVLVFSFFLHTLAYLAKHLMARGYRVATVSGQVPEAEREALRAQFALPTPDERALDVLLSSEVGCEGLDYQFCDRLVNYDIPWNPMRIEQRIGRIDRYGQQSDVIKIFNFITPGTVEERIFFRCFERLGIFQDAIGDLEAVLGDVVQDLNRIAFDPALTPEQAAAFSQQTADNLLRRAEEERRLEQESSALLGLDDAFVADVDEALHNQRFVSADDLRQTIGLYLQRAELGGQLLPDNQHPGCYRLRLHREARAKVLAEIRSMKYYDRPTQALVHWLEGNQPYWLVTFEREAARHYPELPFITAIHPLARQAVAYWTQSDAPLMVQMRVPQAQLARREGENLTIQPGCYLFSAYLWEALAIKPEVRLISQAWDLERACLAPALAERLLPSFAVAEPLDQPLALTGDAVERGLDCLRECAQQTRITALPELQHSHQYLLARRLASLKAYFQNRLHRVRAELEATSSQKIATMKRAEQSRIKQDYEAKLSKLKNCYEADIILQPIAFGIIKVQG